MKHIHSHYANYFNHKYHFTGHVFESRYGAELLTTVEYELEVNKYIHLNPIRANMVQNLYDYKWGGSYFDYINLNHSSLVSTGRILSFFPESKTEHDKKFLQMSVQEQRQSNRIPPFRSPHHSSSYVTLVGEGGSNPKPGEASLAHHRVLFLDELPEFTRKTLDMLREPLESGKVTISRAQDTVTYSCSFSTNFSFESLSMWVSWSEKLILYL
ncbi:Mg(2+) chelatase family protein [Gracilibacillus boraciitolerans JCM 21714]|uniref:Mg(2+) chelatase family protein n=1 Tax=Gracilibacillus boraciitolerans JCM 21714 TaxID=1298598 RepID=W4VGW7_9BACI|nr:ATP-binding protein [Gracilibacillus boraciitolerans]GAE92437.1 Mg(2+) chelatase family protein [Gracilibacillus boraciitolerans JCM 21714]